MRHGLTLCVCLLIVGEAAADIAPPFPYNWLPRRREPRPIPIPDAPRKAPEQWPLKEAAVAVVPLPKEKQTIVLELPRDVFDKLKTAGLDVGDPRPRADAGQPMHTAAAGVSLSLGLVCGGLWLSRRGRRQLALGLGAVALLGTASVIAFANPPTLGVPQAIADNQKISINVVEAGNGIRLHLPESMIPKGEKR